MSENSDISFSRQRHILAQFQSGNTEIFSELYNFYYEPILKYMARRVGNVHIAYDLTSEVFLKAFDALKTFRWQEVSLKSWLYRIANNKLKNYYRDQRVIIHPFENVPEEFHGIAHDALDELREAEEVFERCEQSQKVNEYVAKLKPQYQQAVSLRYSAGLSYKEIAEAMQITDSAVKSLLHRAHKKLRVMGLSATLIIFILFFLSYFL
ncbi:sigma-70 family RNA polymerase sigma factor [Candidatus Peregrinibacteria bacterium]|nr:sigma-70 family RNA polymerase sigma factor [Candidatus Peregrinibacteria bacterium]